MPRVYSCRAFTLAFCATLVLVSVGVLSSTAPVAHLTAFAVSLGGPGARAGSAVVDIVVDRWSTKGEADRLMKVLKTGGPEKLLDALTDIPRVGYIRTPDSIGYPLHFAAREAGEDGGDDITLITDRYISFWEAANRPRTIDYPFTVIQLRLNKDGEGEGKMSVATRITADRHGDRVILENYAAQPVLLKSVHRVD